MSENKGYCIDVVQRELLEALAAEAPHPGTAAGPANDLNGAAHHGADTPTAAWPPSWPAATTGDSPLTGITEAPTLRAHWTVLSTPGWDPESGLLYEPNAEYSPILPTPTKMDAIHAAERLLDLVRDFPFAGTNEGNSDKRNIHRSAWLAGLLTALVRHAIAGPCPLFLFDVNCPGTGSWRTSSPSSPRAGR
jgi:hypothetical protein